MNTKKIIILAVMPLVCSVAFAQIDRKANIQPKIGVNVSTMTGSETGFVNPSYCVGLTGGFELETKNYWNFTFGVGVLYSQQGVNYEKDNGFYQNYYSNYKLRMDYVNIPFLVNFYITKGLAVKTGFQLAFAVKDRVSYTVNNHSSGEMLIDELYKDSDTPLEFDLPIGVSYEYNNFVLDARYNIGLNNAINYETYKTHIQSKHNYFSVTFGYKFNLGPTKTIHLKKL